MTDHSYDFLLLVQQWPKDFGLSEDYMTLHGMWPSRDGTSGTSAASYPCSCTQDPFTDAAIQSIMPDMEKYWPSLKGANDQFWTHEWSKHGTCTGQTELQYFEATLHAREQFDAHKALQAAGFVEGQGYPKSQYDAAFDKSFGVQPELGCDQLNQLREVGFCLSNFPAPMPLDCNDAVLAQHGEANDCDPLTDIIFAAKAAPPSPPRPTPPPGPPATQCAPDQRGPPCTSDADCASKPNCVRCAHSGFCTEQPATEAELLFATEDDASWSVFATL